MLGPGRIVLGDIFFIFYSSAQGLLNPMRAGSEHGQTVADFDRIVRREAEGVRRLIDWSCHPVSR